MLKASNDVMASSIRPSDRKGHGGAKRPLRGQSLKDVQSLRMVQNYPPLTDDDNGYISHFMSFLKNFLKGRKVGGKWVEVDNFKR